MTEHEIASKTIRILTRLGIPRNLRGFGAIVEAVKIIAQNPDNVHQFTKVVYPTIGKNLNITQDQAERIIRTAKAKAIERNEAGVLEICGYDITCVIDTITNAEFLTGLYYYIMEGDENK